MKYFTIPELTRSQLATTTGMDNTPSPEAIANLKALVENILDPLRHAWGHPIIVSSGYRSPAVNAAVQGAKNSQHMKGQAADISTGTVGGNKKLFALVQTLNLPFDQLIDERGFRWLHISYGPSHRRQILHLT